MQDVKQEVLASDRVKRTPTVLPLLPVGTSQERRIFCSKSRLAEDASIKAAIQAAAPYPMPSDPDARREARSVSSTFRAQ
jgi:hypothetical protein